ncbi:hypothetical protein CASFOL_009688 [Castilleja foliolosa]|uniref:Polygalacturonase n=1 Tax=Castilleja foliolosa TaxID=1961234 RepID=A0ABD3DQZ3_9LAMI
MKRSSFVLPLLVLWLLIFLIFSTKARKYHGKKFEMHISDQNISPGGAFPVTESPPVFSILSFGAIADGISDDSMSLLAAWESACSFNGGVVIIPSDFMFMIKPVTLQGPCMPNLVLQIDGTILAPPEIISWPKNSLYQWLNFKWVQNFTVQGTGTADGQGSNWWSCPRKKRARQSRLMKPTALRFYASYNVTVRDISIINSPLCHLKFDNSKGVKVENVAIYAPEYSPNTDGIHLQNSQDVEIMHSDIGTGDDCVSIQTGCSNIHVHHINCGPGHGISLGGLGKDKSVACVSNILVDNIIMQNTMYGARIKTWQGGLGLVTNVTFSNIQVSDVKVPIIIDQYYCDKRVCANQTEAVAISGIKFDQIIGTYTSQPIKLACSNSIPCVDVDLVSIELKRSSHYRGGAHRDQGVCWNSYGRTSGPLVPESMDYCLRSGSEYVKGLARSQDVGCSLGS